MDETKLPLIPDGLILYLEEVYPNEVPMGDISQRELGYKQGIQEVIRHLKQAKKWSEEEDNVQD